MNGLLFSISDVKSKKFFFIYVKIQESIFEGGSWMQRIEIAEVEKALERFKDKEIYLHLETTNGAYAAHRNEGMMTVSAFVRNGKITFSHGKVTGNFPYRVGLKIDDGWVYAQGLTDWELTKAGQLLLAGHDPEGKVAICFQLSEKPFK